MKKILFIAIAIILAIPFINVPAFADSASISLSKSNVLINNQVTVTVNYSSNLSLYTTAGTLTFNSSVLKYVSGGSSVSGSTVSLYKDLNGEQRTSFSIVFTAIAEGSSSISARIDGSDGNTKGSASSSTVVKVSKPAPSSNANLSSLKIDGVDISPAFSQDNTTYSASVANSVESVSIKATAAGSGSTVTGIGDKSLNEGDNSFAITVTAPSGAKKTYTLNIRRRLEGEFTVEELLTVTVNAEQKKICSDISALPVINGFTQTSTTYKDVQVGVLKDSEEKYTLYYLTDENGENPKLYTLNSDGQFELIPMLTFAEKSLIVEDAENTTTVPADYKITDFELNGKKLKAFAFKDDSMKDFYIICCFDGESREYYLYDSLTGVIARYPIFASLLNAKPVSKETPTLINQFKSLPLVFKAIMASCPLLLLAVIILAVLIIVSRKRGRRGYGGYDSDFNLNGYNLDLSAKYIDSDK